MLLSKIKTLSFSALFVLLSQFLVAQTYVDMMQDPSANFYDIQREFNNYWENRPIRKGKGYKQFKRWEYFMEQRVYPTGNIFAPNKAWNEAKAYRESKLMKNGSFNFGNWEPMGPFEWETTSYNPGNGRVNVVVSHPTNPDILFVGTPSGGLWKTTDHGGTWEVLTDSLPVLGVSGIAIHPTNPEIIYIGTGDGDAGDTYSIGVLKSTDGGNTWLETGLNWNIYQNRTVSKLLINNDNPEILVAATSNGLFYTSNGGNSWALAINGSFKDAEYKPGDYNTVYACGTTFVKSTNGGMSFTTITSGVPTSVNRLAIAVTPANPEYVYMVGGKQTNSSFQGLYRSTNSGTSFTLQSSSPNILGYDPQGNDSDGQSWYDLAIAASPGDENLIYVGGVNVWKSTNGGVSWNMNAYWYYPVNTYPYVHADIHALEYLNNNLYAGCDGGIFETIDEGNTWDDLSFGLQIMQFYRISVNPNNYTHVMGGSQDNGSNQYKNNTWTHVLGADGMECIIDPSNPNKVYASTQNGGLNKSTNGGNSFFGITNGISENGPWVTPYVINPQNTEILYAGYSNIWKTTNGGQNWTKITNTSGSVVAIALAPSNPNYVYYSVGSSIYRSTDAGQTWTNLTGNGLTGYITYISVNPSDPNKLYVSISGYNQGNKVYKSTDGGNSWDNISGSLPNLPANCVVSQLGSDEGVYVGTDVGVYYRDNTTGDWVPFSLNLPNVIVQELEINYNANKIIAGTYGRGLWSSDLFVSTPQAPIANFGFSQPSFCEGTTIQFNDLSYFGPNNWQWEFEGGTPAFSTDQSPTITFSTAGKYSVKLKVSNSIGLDSIIKEQLIVINPNTGEMTYPFIESFENENFPIISSNNLLNWDITNENTTWQYTTDAAFTGNGSLKVNLKEVSAGKKLILTTPALDFRGVSGTINMTFRVAYAKQYSTNSDKIEVFFSSDCGNTWVRRFIKNGTNLTTNSGVLVSGDFIPTDNQWRLETVGFNALAGRENALIKFELTTDNGNAIYIDDINMGIITSVPLIEQSKSEYFANVYPNPFTDKFNLELYLPERSNVSVKLTDMLGKEVLHKKSTTFAEGYHTIEFGSSESKIAKGMYRVSVEIDEKLYDYKIISY
jgi:PKD repeat protein